MARAFPFTAILLTDDQGGGYTYYKLRDLGKVLNFNVGWSATAAASTSRATTPTKAKAFKKAA